MSANQVKPCRFERTWKIHHLMALGLALLAGAPAFAVSGTAQVAWGIGMLDNASPGLANFSCRYITRPSVAGNGVRIQLSNYYGDAPLTVRSTTVAAHGSGAAVSGIAAVKFGGNAAVTIPPRSKVMSDPVDLNVAAQQELAVSLFYPGTPAELSENGASRTNSYCTASNAGDVTYEANGAHYTKVSPTVHTVDALDVYQTQPHGAVVALGASITQGLNSSLDQNKRWVDVLSTRFLASSNPKSIANKGISGSTACQAAERFNRDVMALSNVSEVLLGGVGGNDLAYGANGDAVISCLRGVIAQAHAIGIRVVAGTIPPRGFGATQEGYRVQINNWMKANNAFEGVVDFDAVLRNPANPTVLNPAYDSGDGTHPNDVGSAAMANAVPLAAFGNVGAPPPTYVVQGTYDDQDYFAFSYDQKNGSWQHDAACNVTGCYGNTRSWSGSTNDNVTVRFYGTQIKLYGIQKPNFGIGAVSIDGGAETNVDFYAPANVRKLLWTSAVLSSVGPHVFKLRVTGAKNPANTTTQTIIEPDSVDILGSGLATYDDMDYSKFTYVGGNWAHDPTCMPVATPNCYASTKSWSALTNDYVTVAFQGTRARLYGSKNVSFGIGSVSVDNGIETNVDFYAPTRMGNQLMWTSPSLAAGTHTLKLRVKGARDAGSAITIEPDAVMVTP